MSIAYMDKHEKRRISLLALVASLGKGAQKKIEDKTGIAASSISRMLYPPGKKDKKNIGEDSVEKLNDAYPGWHESIDIERTATTEEEILMLKYLRSMSESKRSDMLKVCHALAEPEGNGGAAPATKTGT